MLLPLTTTSWPPRRGKLMRADMADRKSGPTQAILCVEFACECIIHCMTLLLAPLLEVALRWRPFVGLCIGLFSGIWEYEKNPDLYAVILTRD